MVSSAFDPENPKFKCCFGKLHVASVVKQIFYFCFVASCLWAVILVAADFSWALFLALLIAILFEAFIFGTGIYAIQNEKPKCLIPVLAVFISFTIIDAYVIGSDLICKNYKGGWLLYDIFNFAACIYFITIVYACYQYLNAKKQSNVLPMSFTNKDVETMPFVLEEDA